VAYQSLYRKYRPQRFVELVGQEHVTTALRNAVRDQRVGHAYLFSGPRGTGKTTSARILAKALNCLDLGADGEPCGECDHCQGVARGTFMDLFELDAASNRGVGDTRELLERLAYQSATGGKKVYILDEVHMLTDAAANALLKSLEEPPEHVVFVLATTNPEQVLPTIRSRTQHYEFSLLSADDLAAHLADLCVREGVEADPEALAIIARAGAGSARDSLSLLDQALAHSTGRLDAAEVAALFGGAPFELRARILQAVADAEPAAVLLELGALLDAGHEPRRVADDLLRAARDAFLLTAGAGRVPVDGPEEERATLTGIGAEIGTPGLVRILETLGEAMVDMRGIDAADPRLVLEVALVRLARKEAGPPLVLLAERVERLERALDGGAVASARPAPARLAPTAAAPGASATPAPPAAPGPAPSRPGAKPTLGAVRKAQETAVEPAAAPTPVDPTPEPEPASAPGPVEEREYRPLVLDEVVIVWAELLPEFPVATRAAVQHAQPVAVEGDVITFGISPQMLTAARPRFKAVADTIREALAARFGITPKFTLVASADVDLVGGDPFAEFGSAPSKDLPDDLPPDESIADMADADPAEAAVSSVGLLEAEFGATVVEEQPRSAQERS